MGLISAYMVGVHKINQHTLLIHFFLNRNPFNMICEQFCVQGLPHTIAITNSMLLGLMHGPSFSYPPFNIDNNHTIS